MQEIVRQRVLTKIIIMNVVMAFDNVLLEGYIYRLIHLGFYARVIHFIYPCLSNRLFLRVHEHYPLNNRLYYHCLAYITSHVHLLQALHSGRTILLFNLQHTTHTHCTRTFKYKLMLS